MEKIMKLSKIQKSSLAKRNVQKFLSHRLAVTGMVIVIIFILAAIFVPVLSPYDPNYIDTANVHNLKYLPPSSEHWLGTDSVGRDLLTRILYGARISIFVGVASALGVEVLAIFLGCLAGYFGGKVDSIILYISEIFMAFPAIILIMIMVGFLGRSVFNVILVFTLTGWVSTMRMVRGRVLSLREESFVESCKANGISKASIMFRHLLPNTLGPVIVDFTLLVGVYVLSEAGVSFLGIGVDPTIATWGNMINSANSYSIIQNHPVLWLAPGIAICLFALGTNFFGDGLRDVLDPTQ